MTPTVSALVAVARCARVLRRIHIEKLVAIEDLTPFRTLGISDWSNDAGLISCQIDMRSRCLELGHVHMYSKTRSSSMEKQRIMRFIIAFSNKTGVLK